MNKRERNLVIITLLVVGILLSYQFYFADKLETGDTAAAVGNLDEARSTFTDFAGTFAKGRQIRREYARIDIGIPERTGTKQPTATFSDELYKMLTTQFSVDAPRMGTPKRVAIKDVDDYYFIEIDVTITDTLDNLIKLLRELDGGGLLIKSFTLDKRSRGQDLAQLDMTVARLVKHDEESRKILSRRR